MSFDTLRPEIHLKPFPDSPGRLSDWPLTGRHQTFFVTTFRRNDLPLWSFLVIAAVRVMSITRRCLQKTRLRKRLGFRGCLPHPPSSASTYLSLLAIPIVVLKKRGNCMFPSIPCRSAHPMPRAASAAAGELKERSHCVRDVTMTEDVSCTPKKPRMRYFASNILGGNGAQDMAGTRYCHCISGMNSLSSFLRVQVSFPCPVSTSHARNRGLVRT